MKITKQIKFTAALLICSSIGYTSWADPPNRPYSDPKKDGYGIENDASPWFDGKEYPYYQEMFNGKGIKPQEEGTYQMFPKGSVPVQVVLGKIKPIYEPIVPLAQREAEPQNPTQATVDSIAQGKILFNTYCIVCHGKDGKSMVDGKPVNRVIEMAQGKLAIPPDIGPLIQAFSGTHLYNKIRYGSAYNTGSYQATPGLMPPYGIQTSVQDRWDMVNYMKSPNFGKEAN